MAKFALGLEYDGSCWRGWQRQLHCRTVQAELERVLSQIADEPIDTVCAGRTDSGVHALNQVVHFKVNSPRSHRPEHAWVFGGNRYLEPGLRILWAKLMPEDFSARYSAFSRAYTYVIYNSRIRPGLAHKRVAWFHRPIDVQLMQQAAQLLIGEHDFSAFRDKFCQSLSTVRHLKSIQVRRQGDHVLLDIEANAFLHHMVRNIVGVLLPIAYGVKPVHWAREVLESQQRSAAGITAPAAGLYLRKVSYFAKYNVPEPSDNHVIIF